MPGFSPADVDMRTDIRTLVNRDFHRVLYAALVAGGVAAVFHHKPTGQRFAEASGMPTDIFPDDIEVLYSRVVREVPDV